VETTAANGVTDALATVRGTVADAGGETVNYRFEYGPTTSYGTQSPEGSLEVEGDDDHAFDGELAGLDAEATFHFRACAKAPDTVCGEDSTFTTAASPSVEADPSLLPAFESGVSDYVARCEDESVTVDVATPEGTALAVGEGDAQSGAFSEALPLTAGEAFTFTTETDGRSTTFHVRCLPPDFPDWTFERPGQPSARFYVTTPHGVATPDGSVSADYVAIFDDHGVPVWWRQARGATDAKVLADDTLVWGNAEPGEGFNLASTAGIASHGLDGGVLHTWHTDGSVTDFHDLELLPNGNVLIGTYAPRSGVQDLTVIGDTTANATVFDGEVQEVTPDGDVVWTWSTRDHVDLSEAPQRRRDEFLYLPKDLPDGRQAFDWAHLNSIQEVDGQVILSFRHLDAVYAIDKSDGEILWKLGGTERPESLTVVDDPESDPLGGQHDARLQEDGTLTIYDNNSEEGIAPRAVRYELDLEARTATLVESVEDEDAPDSPCCGSATRLEDGSWVMSWGGTRVISEFGPDGDRHFVLTFVEVLDEFGLSYRVGPVEGPWPTIEDLRAGMDEML
jgi:hypothetical protein